MGLALKRLKIILRENVLQFLPLTFSRERNQVERKVERKRLDYFFVSFTDYEGSPFYKKIRK